MCIGLSSQMKLDKCPFKEDQNSMSVLPGGMGSKGKLTWLWRGVGLAQECRAVGQEAGALPLLPPAVVFGGGLRLP